MLALVRAPASNSPIHAPPSHPATGVEDQEAVAPVQLPVNTVIPPTQFNKGYCESGRQVKEEWKQGRKAVITF